MGKPSADVISRDDISKKTFPPSRLSQMNLFSIPAKSYKSNQSQLRIHMLGEEVVKDEEFTKN